MAHSFLNKKPILLASTATALAVLTPAAQFIAHARLAHNHHHGNHRGYYYENPRGKNSEVFPDEERYYDHIIEEILFGTDYYQNDHPHKVEKCNIEKKDKNHHSEEFPENLGIYRLAMQRSDSEKGQLTLHGLWPQWTEKCYDNTEDVVEYVQGVLSNHTNLYDEMKEKWGSTHDKPTQKEANFWFWGHEYSKHGSCSVKHGDAEDMVEYFQMALNFLQTVRNDENAYLNEQEDNGENKHNEHGGQVQSYGFCLKIDEQNSAGFRKTPCPQKHPH